MSALEPTDILDLASYETVRDAYRQRVLAHKAPRRVAVGDRVSLTFEDRETVRYQIQEMARVERVTDAARIAHEVEVYGELLPNAEELAATLFIEIPDLQRIRPELDRLLGIDECVLLDIGPPEDAIAVRADFDPRQLDEERISAVHYLRFRLPPEARERLSGGAPARVRIDHTAYAHTAELGEATLASLRHDLAGTTPALLDLQAAAARAPRDRVLEAGDGYRVLEPAVPLRRRHVVVEAIDAGPDVARGDDRTVARLFEVARRHARALAGEGIACRIIAAVEPEPGGDARAAIQVVSTDG